MSTISKSHPRFSSTLAQYVKTREGQAFVLSIASQLIDGFEVNHKGKIESVVTDTDIKIVLDLE